MSSRIVLTNLLIPPNSLVYLALLGLLLARRRRGRAGQAVSLAALAGMLVLGVPVISHALLVSLEGGEAPQGAEPPQAIVILSAEVDRTPDGLEPGPLTLQRMLAGARLWQRTHLPVLVSGGSLEPGDTPVAVVMARTLERDFHVPVRWIEGRSETTWENAADSAAILLPEGVRSVYLVTHAWHERRSVLSFRHFGLEPTVAAVPADIVTGGVVPTAVGWAESFHALHEWIGLAVYSVRARFSTQSNKAA
ncbi:MAG TPA: YdcF family protein [Acetobacteraceae bacterium]|nr:YdcF family protein [Acetobacteraceae bacterium]